MSNGTQHSWHHEKKVRVRYTLRSMTGVTVDVAAKADKLDWDRAGHVMGMHPDRWASLHREGAGQSKASWSTFDWRKDSEHFRSEWKF